MKSKIIAIIVASFVFLSSSAVCADSNEQMPIAPQQGTEENEPVTYTLSLADAIEMAYDGNQKLISNQSAQKGNQVNLQSAKITKIRLKNVPVNVSSSFETLLAKQGYYLDAAKTAYALSVKENDLIHAQIAYDVTNAYYNYALMQKLVNAAQNSYELALENNKMVEAQFNLGLISQLDYENASIVLTKAQNAVKSYQRSLAIAEDNLKIQIGKFNENCNIVITDEIECEEYTSDVYKDAETAMETRYDITALKENLVLAQKYMDIADCLTEGSATYCQAYASLVKAEYNYNNTKDLISLSIKNNYNDVINTKAEMDTAEAEYNLKLKEFDSAKLRYELGMITNIEFTEKLNNLYQYQVSYAKAKSGYRMAVEKYKYSITIGL